MRREGYLRYVSEYVKQYVPRTLLGAVFFLAAATQLVAAQQVPPKKASASAAAYERTFPQSKAALERALKQLQPSLSGRLPLLEGFAAEGDQPLSRYQRAYFQSEVQVTALAGGGSRVRVSTKVTAWYADPIVSRSGYKLVPSNGRLESDLLDQLTDLLAAHSPAAGESESAAKSSPANSPPPAKLTANPEAGVSAPAPKSETPSSFPSSTSLIQAAKQLADTRNLQKPDRKANALETEAASLAEVLKNQAHPKNLVAVKKTGTPVVSAPSLNASPLFLANEHDEFEMLDYSNDWVHVRISGLSRGWIWRTSLEMPEGISDVPTSAPAAPVAADLFQVTREETAPFPGDWAPLRGKTVKIISVQKIQENEKDSGAEAKLEFAKSLLDKNYPQLEAQSKELSGIVLIFDSIDGGMIAATLPTVQQWRAGTLSDAALWHQCYFDPPETFTVAAPSGGS